MRRQNGPLLASLAVAFCLSGCAHVTNVSLCGRKDQAAGGACEFDANPENTYRFSPKPDKSTLVIVTFSGGVRARRRSPSVR